MIFETHAHMMTEAFDGDRGSLLTSMAQHGIGNDHQCGRSLRGVEDTVRLTESILLSTEQWAFIPTRWAALMRRK